MQKKKKTPSLEEKSNDPNNEEKPLAKEQESTDEQAKEKPAKKFPASPGGFVKAINYPVVTASLPLPSPISKPIEGDLVSLNNFLPKKLPEQLEGNLTGKGFAAAVIDTGVYRHDDLKGAIIDRFDCTGEETRVSDIHGHGTHIAGIIAGANGIAKEGGIVSLKVTTKSSSETTWGSIASALKKVLDHNREVDDKLKKAKSEEVDKIKSRKISVVNLSFNGFDNSDNPTLKVNHRIFELISELHENDIPVVVSGGNYFDYMVKNKEVEVKYGLAYPANCKLTISAGASFGKKKELFGFDFEKGEPAPFTQRLDPSKGYAFFMAPAVCTTSAGIYGPKSYTEMTGSSQAAPVITGIILLLQQKFSTNGTLPSVEEIKKKLFEISRTAKNHAARADQFVARGAARNVMNWYYDDKEYEHLFHPDDLS